MRSLTSAFIAAYTKTYGVARKRISYGSEGKSNQLIFLYSYLPLMVNKDSQWFFFHFHLLLYFAICVVKYI